MKHGPEAARLKPQRRARRERQRIADRAKEQQNREKAIGGGEPNELGVVQGQNGEQGNTVNPRNAQPNGRSGH